jgi:chromosomal replication initiation ATPase DnaA
MIATEKKQEVDQFVRNFIEEFKIRYNVEPTVIYNMAVQKVDIHILEKVVNDVLWESNPKQYTDGIRKRSRQLSLAEHRQVFYKVAREMGYNYSYLARFLGFDHATAIHAVKKVSMMLNIKDKVIGTIYSKIKNKLNDKEYIQNIGREQAQSESDLSAL